MCGSMTAMSAGSFDRDDAAVAALRETPAPELVARRADLQAAAKAAGLSASDIEAVLNARRELPRPLLADERATLLALLNHADFEGRDALVAQVESVRVDSYCGCGCATVGLVVDRSLPSAPLTYRPIPNEAAVYDPEGEPLGGVIVFADDGYLSNLEIYWYETPISPFPPIDRLQVTTRAS